MRLKTGDNFDDLIAEKVMGFSKVLDDDGTLISFIDEPNEMEYFCSDDESEFSPTTDIGDAWRVLERLKELGFGVNIYGQKGFDYKVEIYYKTFSTEFFYFDSGEVLGEEKSAPLAICKAALKAVGMEDYI